MTREEKQLLLQDLSAKLPYGVKVHCEWNYYKGERAREDGILTEIDFLGNTILFQRSNDQITRIPFNRIDGTVKPFLRPMSSMTEEEKEEFHKLKQFSVTVVMPNGVSLLKPTYIVDLEEDGDGLNHLYDWLNAHHFDYRGLIEKGLALEAPEGMYNIELL